MNTIRGYLTTDELKTRLGLAAYTGTEEAEYLARIDFAEQLIDNYVGFQDKFFTGQKQGINTGAVGKTIFDQSGNTQLSLTNGYFVGMILDIVGGTGAGQTRRISASDKDDRSVTYEGDSLDPAAAADTFFRIYQLGKFPRRKDVVHTADGLTVYKTIPEAVKAAVAAQVEFIVEQGDDFFTSDQSDKQSEHIGNYSYSKGGQGGNMASSAVKMIAPKAKSLLQGIMNRTGRMVV